MSLHPDPARRLPPALRAVPATAACGFLLGVLHLSPALGLTAPWTSGPRLVGTVVLLSLLFRLWNNMGSVIGALCGGGVAGLAYFGTALHWLGSSANPDPSTFILQEAVTTAGAMWLFVPWWTLWWAGARMLTRLSPGLAPVAFVAAFAGVRPPPRRSGDGHPHGPVVPRGPGHAVGGASALARPVRGRCAPGRGGDRRWPGALPGRTEARRAHRGDRGHRGGKFVAQLHRAARGDRPRCRDAGSPGAALAAARGPAAAGGCRGHHQCRTAERDREGRRGGGEHGGAAGGRVPGRPDEGRGAGRGDRGPSA